MSTERSPWRPPRPDLEAIEGLTREALTSARNLTPQVLEHLLSAHEVLGERAAAWLREELGSLESYEIDLLLSPVFTPAFATRLRFEDGLGEGSLEASDVEGLVDKLAAEDLRLTLVHEGEEVRAPLPRVVVERFVRLLHLDAPLPEEAVSDFGPLAPEVRVHLRDRAWRRPQSRSLLPVLLYAAQNACGDFSDYVHFLTDFLRSYRPASRQDCLTFLDNLAQAYQDDLESHQSGSRSFFDPELKAAYAGKWSVDEDIVASHRRMIAMARALKREME